MGPGCARYELGQNRQKANFLTGAVSRLPGRIDFTTGTALMSMTAKTDPILRLDRH
jgi:hypothetical protein